MLRPRQNRNYPCCSARCEPADQPVTRSTQQFSQRASDWFYLSVFLFRQAEIYKHGCNIELSSRRLKGSNSFDIGSIVVGVSPNFCASPGLGTRTLQCVYSHDQFEGVELAFWCLDLFKGLDLVLNLFRSRLCTGRLEFDSLGPSQTNTHRKFQWSPQPTGSTENQWNDHGQVGFYSFISLNTEDFRLIGFKLDDVLREAFQYWT